MPSEDVSDNGLHRVGTDRRRVAFPPACDAGVGCDFDEDPISPSPAGGWRSGDDDVKIA